MLAITENLAIPEQELTFTFSRSSGPGGQNVNKVSTRVSLIFDVKNSPSLSPEDKTRILAALATRISKTGLLRVVSYRHRTQGANREAATLRFVELLQDALRPRKPRKKSRLSAAAHERRLTAKKHRSRLKQERGGRGNF